MVVAWLLAAAVTAAFALLSARTGWLQALAAASLTACGAFACWSWRRTPVGEVRWDGEQWHLGNHGAAEMQGHVSVALDLQSVLLVRFTAPGAGSSWNWLDSKADSAQWADLRRAVYSRARIAAVREPEEYFRDDAAALR